MNNQIITNVFTYGSLMYPEVMGKLVKQNYQHQKATLQGYQRRHVKNAVYPGITPHEGRHVQGVVYYAVNEEDLQALDYFQTDDYQRVKVQIETLQGNIIQSYVYQFVNIETLEDEEWRIQEFENKHKHTFAQSHLGSKEEIQTVPKLQTH